MQVLVALAKARPNVVSRDQLIDQCWEGRIVGDDALNRCIVALRQLAREFDPEPFAVDTVARVGYRLTERPTESGPVGKPPEPRARAKRPLIMAAIVGLAAIAIAGLLYFRPWQTERSSTVLLTTPVSDPDSRALARDLAVRLGGLPPIQHGSMGLIVEGEDSSANADLVLEVEGGEEARLSRESVALKTAKNRSILWSQSFQGGSKEDLQLQTAHAAAAALRCAAEAKASPQPLSQQYLGAYINGCLAVLEIGKDVGKTVQSLEGVVQASPRFNQGWAKLLAVESEAITNSGHADGIQLRPALERHIAEARKVDPDLAEAFVAQAILTPEANFTERSRLLELAVARNPNHAGARVILAQFLISVGQVNRGVDEARRAVEIDPLSPAVRSNYALALAIRGRTDAARTELAEAQRIWPGSSSVREIRYILYLRFDDPREALRMIRSDAGNSGGALLEKFLQARIDRSPANVEAAVEQGRVYFRNDPRAIAFHAQTLAEFDRTEELLGLLLNWQRRDITDFVTDVVFRPAFADVHRDARFMRAAQRLGLLEYWRASGHWPDFCSDPDLPYDCKAAAAKLERTAG
jgi:Flp pilus assembly protein TadD